MRGWFTGRKELCGLKARPHKAQGFSPGNRVRILIGGLKDRARDLLRSLRATIQAASLHLRHLPRPEGLGFVRPGFQPGSRWFAALGGLLAGWAFVGILANSATAAPGDLGLPPIGDGQAPEAETSMFVDELGWTPDLEQALALAAAEYRPVVVFFHADWCAWCRRTRLEVFADTEVNKQLEHFVRVEVDIDKKPEVAQKYIVRGVPAFRILSAEGAMRNGADGFVTAPQLLGMLRGAMNAEFLRQQDPEFLKLIKALESGKLEEVSWPEVMLSLGDTAKRPEIRKELLKQDPFPRAEMVKMLENVRLPARPGTTNGS